MFNFHVTSGLLVAERSSCLNQALSWTLEASLTLPPIYPFLSPPPNFIQFLQFHHFYFVHLIASISHAYCSLIYLFIYFVDHILSSPFRFLLPFLLHSPKLQNLFSDFLVLFFCKPCWIGIVFVILVDAGHAAMAETNGMSSLFFFFSLVFWKFFDIC